MEIDWSAVRARFAAMTREELLEEVALRLDEYAPQAQRILEGEARDRGITATQIDERRRAGAAVPEETVAAPALLTSADDKEQVSELARLLRGRGIPAVVKEIDVRAFHGSGHLVGRWGLMVAGPLARRAAALLETVVRPSAAASGAACGGGCGSCGAAGDTPGEEWPEDGDWWKTGPGEDDPEGERR